MKHGNYDLCYTLDLFIAFSFYQTFNISQSTQFGAQVPLVERIFSLAYKFLDMSPGFMMNVSSLHLQNGLRDEGTNRM